MRGSIFRVASLATALACIAAGEALACSCIAVDAETRLREADGAFVGTVVSRRVEEIRGWTTFTVEKVYKGDIGTTVEVETGGDPNSCAIRSQPGQRLGLFLRRAENGTWHAGSCDIVAPAKLEEVTRGSVRTLVAGTFDGTRLLAIDGAGRVIGYGAGAGDGQRVAACADGRRVAEAYLLDGSWRLAVRELPGLKVLDDRALRAGAGSNVLLHCAEDPAAIVLDSGRAVVRRFGSRPAVLHRGTARAAGFGPGIAYVAGASEVRAVNLRSGRRTVVARVRGLFGELSGGPDGFVVGRSRDRVVLLPGRGVVRRARGGNVEGPVGLAGNLVVATHSGGRVLVFDRFLRRKSVFSGFPAAHLAVRGSRVWGLGPDGSLLTARLPGGPGQRLARLPDGQARDIAAVTAAQPSASQARTSSPCSSSAGGFKRI